MAPRPSETPAGAHPQAAGGYSTGAVPGRLRAGPRPPLGWYPAGMAGRPHFGPRWGTARVLPGPARTRGLRGPPVQGATLTFSTRTRPWRSAAGCPRLRGGRTGPAPTHSPRCASGATTGRAVEAPPSPPLPVVSRRQSGTLAGGPGQRGSGTHGPGPRDAHVPGGALRLYDRVLVPH